MWEVLIFIGFMVAIYEAVNITWWLTTDGKDSFTKHIRFCIKKSMKK